MASTSHNIPILIGHKFLELKPYLLAEATPLITGKALIQCLAILGIVLLMSYVRCPCPEY